MDDNFTPDPATVTLATMALHRLHVSQAMRHLIFELEHRAHVHDASKFQEDEFSGFSRINAIARQFPYGSAEYRQALNQEKPTIDLHYDRNSHHPESWEHPEDMGLLDLIEMVCDWWGAWVTYEAQRPIESRTAWSDNMEKQKARFFKSGMLNTQQWFVVEQVSALLVPE